MPSQRRSRAVSSWALQRHDGHLPQGLEDCWPGPGFDLHAAVLEPSGKEEKFMGLWEPRELRDIRTHPSLHNSQAQGVLPSSARSSCRADQPGSPQNPF